MNEQEKANRHRKLNNSLKTMHSDRSQDCVSTYPVAGSQVKPMGGKSKKDFWD